jgi:hypothetical protein
MLQLFYYRCLEPILRTKSIGTKVTEDEDTRLKVLASGRGHCGKDTAAGMSH